MIYLLARYPNINYVYLIFLISFMKSSEASNSLRKKIQNNIFKFILISIGISVVIFSYEKDGFFFGI
ncbi:Hypothetical protein P9215_16581 [Prochlorococcus marinus str. MIT 9215]|uniref:Uncharacterized protein n=1 Tax=Prochlorococcus marinus (strain MIT 9215) TaxID=93060 RepID=A8G6P0_PROM2|nr:Hypothetical protein P9215_16581 [Prochlorococcus marinus str. MIT 9215]